MCGYYPHIFSLFIRLIKKTDVFISEDVPYSRVFRERWQRQQSLEVEEGVVVVEAANMRSKELATIRKLGLTLPVLPIQASGCNK